MILSLVNTWRPLAYRGGAGLEKVCVGRPETETVGEHKEHRCQKSSGKCSPGKGSRIGRPSGGASTNSWEITSRFQWPLTFPYSSHPGAQLTTLVTEVVLLSTHHSQGPELLYKHLYLRCWCWNCGRCPVHSDGLGGKCPREARRWECADRKVKAINLLPV